MSYECVFTLTLLFHLLMDENNYTISNDIKMKENSYWVFFFLNVFLMKCKTNPVTKNI